MRYKIVFLDRDGTINKEKNYLYKVDEFEFLSGVVSGLKKLQKKGFLIVIITNQSGIARGFYTEKDLEILHTWMIQELEQRGVHIEKIYYCPHHPDAVVGKYRKHCNCRKPKTGLFWRAIVELQKEFDIDLANSIAIGDKERDLAICSEISLKGYLIGSDYCDSIITGVPDFKSAIEFILKEKRNEN